jgi:phosphoglycolate phosphatase
MGGESALYSSLRLTRQHARARIAALSASGNSSGDIMPIRAILFDKDGTLVDFDRTWGPAVGAVLQHLACGDDALYRKLCAVTGLVDGARFLPDSPFIDGPTSVFAGCWATVLGRPADAPFLKEIDRLLCEATTARLAAIGDPKAVLAELAGRGYRLGLITNDAEATARAHARKLGLEPMLAFIAGYDSGFGAKPAPGPVLAFAAAIGVSTSEIVVVGDTALDVVTARAAGAKAVVVLSGPRSADDLQQAKADAVIASIAQLSAWLE